ncbi:hypothetical protein K438DRAFT_2031230 [Mycena galopus ATCC 62051]|nr:hypothetical protein K438DRAFT_2031230 [Mycena galopus ATCC 62051]
MDLDAECNGHRIPLTHSRFRKHPTDATTLARSRKAQSAPSPQSPCARIAAAIPRRTAVATPFLAVTDQPSTTYSPLSTVQASHGGPHELEISLPPFASQNGARQCHGLCLDMTFSRLFTPSGRPSLEASSSRDIQRVLRLLCETAAHDSSGHWQWTHGIPSHSRFRKDHLITSLVQHGIPHKDCRPLEEYPFSPESAQHHRRSIALEPSLSFPSLVLDSVRCLVAEDPLSMRDRIQAALSVLGKS